MNPRAPSSIGLRSDRGPILIALMVSTGVVAIDATILSTAVPSIVADLGGFSQFPWLFSTFLLAQAVSVPVYAKLADIFGRKPVMLFGLGLFLLGSVLCGCSWDMTSLIIFRAVQGLGAGAVQPMSVTIAGDVYTVAERAKVQGYIASVWAMSSLIGPTLGGLFAQLDAWRWIFFVNIPICVIAGYLLWRNFSEKVSRTDHRIDVLGSVLLTLAMTLLILGLLEGGQAWAWASPISLMIFGTGVFLLVAFCFAERRAAEPVLPLWVLRRRLLASTSLLSLAIGGIIIGLTSYVPTYLEKSIHVKPLVAGLALAALTLGWPISATLSGRIFLRIGFRSTALIGLGIAFIGMTSLALTAGHPQVPVVAATCFVTGLGMGLTASPSLIAAQSSVPWAQRGVVTGSNLFARSIGSAIGAAAFGAVANSIIAGYAGGEDNPAAVIDGSQTVFYAALIALAIAAVAALAMPRLHTEATA